MSTPKPLRSKTVPTGFKVNHARPDRKLTDVRTAKPIVLPSKGLQKRNVKR